MPPSILLLLTLFALGHTAWAQNSVNVSNATELNSAIADGVYITLTDDITLSEHLTIPNDNTVTINLNGHTLSRSLSGASSQGCVIIVAATGNLTLTGCQSVAGGAIHLDDGTTMLIDMTITNNTYLVFFDFGDFHPYADKDIVAFGQQENSDKQ